MYIYGEKGAVWKFTTYNFIYIFNSMPKSKRIILVTVLWVIFASICICCICFPGSYVQKVPLDTTSTTCWANLFYFLCSPPFTSSTLSRVCRFDGAQAQAWSSSISLFTMCARLALASVSSFSISYSTGWCGLTFGLARLAQKFRSLLVWHSLVSYIDKTPNFR